MGISFRSCPFEAVHANDHKTRFQSMVRHFELHLSPFQICSWTGVGYKLSLTDHS